MQKKIYSVTKLKRKFPYLKRYIPSRLNEDIYKYASTFLSDGDVLFTALLINPLGKTEKLTSLESLFNKSLVNNLRIINRLYLGDEKIIKNYQKYNSFIIIYLSCFKILFDNFSKKELQKLFSFKNLRYAMKLVEKNDITELRIDLEDNFFSLLYPEVFKNYYSLLKFTKKKFAVKQKEILKSFNKLIKDSHIQAQIEGRIKTIYSIHNKILKKNILFSQILDTIGIRILVETEEDCYRSMACVLKNYPIMTSRVKDYIAVPKENGYQSIHLTILFDNHPVEIQIRTFHMHVQAQFGKASHLAYKNYA